MFNNIKNFFSLTVQVHDYNLAAQDPAFIRSLRNLTLSPISGMNHELDNFAQIRLERDVNCRIFTAHRNDEMIGWAFLSKELTTFCFINSYDGFNPKDGSLFQVYVKPEHRRQGVAAELLKTAHKYANDGLCVCPWDQASRGFYQDKNSYVAKLL